MAPDRPRASHSYARAHAAPSRPFAFRFVCALLALHVRPSLYALLVLFVVALPGVGATLQCRATPAWVESLPQEASVRSSENDDFPAATSQALLGRWERLAPNRYGAEEPLARSRGRETLVFEREDQAGSAHRISYIKLHLYREIVGRRQETRVYREAGRVELRGPWALLRPQAAGHFHANMEFEAGQTPRAPDGTPRIDLPHWSELIGEGELESVAPPAPLLFLFQARVAATPNDVAFRETSREAIRERARSDISTRPLDAAPLVDRLVPLAYEWMGERAAHGVFEGAPQPYTIDAPSFRHALIVWTEKRYRPHHYSRLSRVAE